MALRNGGTGNISMVDLARIECVCTQGEVEQARAIAGRHIGWLRDGYPEREEQMRNYLAARKGG